MPQHVKPVSQETNKSAFSDGDDASLGSPQGDQIILEPPGP